MESKTATQLDPRDLPIIHKILQAYQKNFEELYLQVQNSEEAFASLESFLTKLRAANSNVGGLLDSSNLDFDMLQKSKMVLDKLQQTISPMVDKAMSLDSMLNKSSVHLKEAESGKRTCCSDLIAELKQKLEGAYENLKLQGEILQQKELQKNFLTKIDDLVSNLQEIFDKVDKMGLNDSTIPAVQQRLNSLNELKNKLHSYDNELKSLRETAAHQLLRNPMQGEDVKQQVQKAGVLWEETEKSLTECQEQCNTMLKLLKKFQEYKSVLTTKIQKGDDAITEQASYLGKANLQKLIEKLEKVKEELDDSSDTIDTVRNVCSQLQSQLRKIPNCKETPFEKEADALTDRWLDTTEKLENYRENLRRALGLWENGICLAHDVENWAKHQVENSEEHPLAELEIARLETEIKRQDENVEQFHSKATEIQHLLQSTEFPLELQVIETSLKNKMDQLKELCVKSKENVNELCEKKAQLKEEVDFIIAGLNSTENFLNHLNTLDDPLVLFNLQDTYKEIAKQKKQIQFLLDQINCLSTKMNPDDIADLKEDSDRLNEMYIGVKELCMNKQDILKEHLCHGFKEHLEAVSPLAYPQALLWHLASVAKNQK
ncbi:nesprin-2-like [Latimeria chalumnae]|uniref:nesprin-2-like n=1 Tax=Latimeria chalumnae TaxID=7897 RepID=UPI00313ACBC8